MIRSMSPSVKPMRRPMCTAAPDTCAETLIEQALWAYIEPTSCLLHTHDSHCDNPQCSKYVLCPCPTLTLDTVSVGWSATQIFRIRSGEFGSNPTTSLSCADQICTCGIAAFRAQATKGSGVLHTRNPL